MIQMGLATSALLAFQFPQYPVQDDKRSVQWDWGVTYLVLLYLSQVRFPHRVAAPPAAPAAQRHAHHSLRDLHLGGQLCHLRHHQVSPHYLLSLWTAIVNCRYRYLLTYRNSATECIGPCSVRYIHLFGIQSVRYSVGESLPS